MTPKYLALVLSGSLLALLAASFFPIWPVWYENQWEGLGHNYTLWKVPEEVMGSGGEVTISANQSMVQGVIVLAFGAWLGGAAHTRLFPNDGWWMTAAEAITHAQRVAAENGWTWLGPGVAWKMGLLTRLIYAVGGGVWEVVSHSGYGCRVWVVLRDADARVLFKGFDPR